MNATDLVYALLFVSEEPVPLAQLAITIGLTEGQTEQALELLTAQLAKSGPIACVEIAGGYQLATKPEYADLISRFLRPQRGKLSKSLMEVLAIIAYRQPITALEIELVRGVHSDYAIRCLVERHLIREVGRKQAPGRPVLYGTTPQFLHQFNLNSERDLPPITDSRQIPAIEQASQVE